jgi:PAS domain S-box-containing protein
MTQTWSEIERLRALGDLRILDTGREAAFDDIASLAAELFDVPMSAISLVDNDRQWFKAEVGLGVDATPRDVSFCSHAMWDEDVFVVLDASRDERFRDNALVTGPPRVRFYAGAPLRSPEGAPLGALCVIDSTPRTGVSERQKRSLRILASQAGAQMALRASAARERERERWFHALADSMPQMVWSTLPDGYHDYYNERWYEFTGAPSGTTDGEGWNDMFHPEDQDRAWTTWRKSLETGAPYQIEYRLRHRSGDYRWVLGRALPVRDEAGAIIRWFGTCTDIHEAKQASERNELLSRELSHRIKNIFSVIGGLVALGARSFPASRAFAAAISERILALGRAHDFIRPQGDQPNAAQRTLAGLLAELSRPYSLGEERILLTGQDIVIDERAATALALVFHELATNAAKYGALSAPGGQVQVDISAAAGEASIVWRETGGPAVVGEPQSIGFGSTLVRLSFEDQFRGAIERRWAPEGLVVTLRAPLAALGALVVRPALTPAT